MALVPIPVTDIDADGVAAAAPTNADTVNNHSVQLGKGGTVILRIQNSDAGAAHNCTVITPGDVKGAAIADTVIAVAASGVQLVELDEDLYMARSGANKGKAQVNPSHANLSFQAYRVR